MAMGIADCPDGGHCQNDALIEELVEACKALMDALPDSAAHESDSWDWCWNELTEDAQETVKRARQLANAAIAGAKPGE